MSSNTDSGNGSSKRARIFISYRRNVEPDEPVALQVFNDLKRDHDVFIDRTMLVGTEWGERIEAELRQADYLITFLSASSVNSEMVTAEISTAHKLSKDQNGRPMILPVRIDYREPFRYPLSAYLDHINWAFWRGHDDTARVIEELKKAINGGDLSIAGSASKSEWVQVESPKEIPLPLPSAQPIRLEMPEGTMDVESEFYIERPADAIALEAIKRHGVTMTIKAPRQMGKSSLLIRTISTVTDKQVAFLDFQLFDRQALADADLFFRQFCAWLSDSLELDNRTDEHWSSSLSIPQRCTRYFGRYILKQIDRPIVLAMDEVESMFDTEFRTDFFGMLRSWHNNRASQPIWKRLNLALVTSTEPYQLIKDLNQSPFNVGEVIELSDFTPEQVVLLNQRHNSPLNSGDIQELIALLNGHPYLVRRALYLVASKRISAKELFNTAADDRGPFGDHLRHHLFRLHDQKDLIQGLRQVLHRNKLEGQESERIFFRLRGAGLVRREGSLEVMRCKLYADYFQEHLYA